MVSTSAGVSPIATAAIQLIGRHATVEDLERRFAEDGADLRPGVAGGALDELAALGLVRVARGSAAERTFVLTTLGRKLAARGLSVDGGLRLEELERLRTDLLSTIAHELRTPLTALRTSAGLLLDPASEPTDEQRRSMLETIDRNAERMQRLVGDILDLARFRYGAIRLQRRLFDPLEIVESTVATVMPLALAAGQHLETSLRESPRGKVFGDRRRLEQALLNLLSNAQRYSPRGARIHVGVVVADGSVRWTVTDDGPGITTEDQQQLFERFFVGRSDRNLPRHGVGLGLPTALAIAQAHGGTIDVDSTPGVGSRFTVEIPLDGPPEEA